MFSKGFLKEDKKLFDNFKNNIKEILNSKYQDCIIFYWEDGTGERLKYHLERLFGGEIIYHKNTDLINFHKTTQRNLKKIIEELIPKLQITLDDDILQSFNGNFYKIKEYIKYEYIKMRKGNLSKAKLNKDEKFFPPNNYKYFNNKQVHSQEIIRKNSNPLNKSAMHAENEEDFSNFSIFHLIGKILYNKRLDPITNKPIAMTKSQLTQNPAPKMYFNLKNMITSMRCSNKLFNETLIENSFDHFKDLKELTYACDAFSLANTLEGSNRKLYKNFNDESSLEYMQSIITSMACMQLNKSQYNTDNPKMYIIYLIYSYF